MTHFPLYEAHRRTTRFVTYTTSVAHALLLRREIGPPGLGEACRPMRSSYRGVTMAARTLASNVIRVLMRPSAHECHGDSCSAGVLALAARWRLLEGDPPAHPELRSAIKGPRTHATLPPLPPTWRAGLVRCPSQTR